MILRKPYALLIKHFQKIHLLLILICAYIFYKLTILRSFVSDFLQTESYDSYYEPISNYISFLVIIGIIAVIAIVIVLIVLLRYKKKPWKVYLFPFLLYTFMLGVLLYVRNYFVTYDEASTITAIMAGRDLLTLAYFPQYIVFVIFGVRFLGIDLKKFGFKNDEEYLDIKEEDREEVEISFEFDKDKIIRNIKKFFRNARYVYLEHRLICNSILIIIFVGVTGYTYYYFGILHRTYKEGNTFTANYYAITVNNSYLTDYDSNGNNITSGKDYSYLVINVTVKNLAANRRTVNIERFRILNKNNQFRYVSREYDNFKDLGKEYDKSKQLATDEEFTFILVYKVDKNLDVSKYVLYYPDVSNGVLLKKIRLSVQDTRELDTASEVSLNENMTFPTGDELTVTSAKVVDTTTYGRYTCTNSCGIKEMTLTPTTDNKILEISFVSNNFTGKSFIDFSNIYAKINYKDNSGEEKTIAARSMISDYSGNFAYFSVPNDVDPTSIALVFTFRSEEYIYNLN